MHVIYEEKEQKTTLKYGDIIKYQNDEICILANVPISYDSTVLIVLDSGKLLRSYQNLDEIGDEVEFICENKHAKLTLPK